MAEFCLFLLFCTLTFVFVDTRSTHYRCPSECSCLGTMVDCSKRGIVVMPTDIPHWVSILELQSNSISGIQEDAFEGLTDLVQLDLSYNNLNERNFSVNVFNSIPKLHTLKLSYNQFTDLPSLVTLQNLTHLSFHHNHLVTFSSDSLRHTTALRVLDLSFNRLTHVNAFPVHQNLRHLFLSNNRIANLEAGCFDNLTGIEWLKLNKNRVSVIPKNLFNKLGTLKTLELNRNRIDEIEDLSFQGLMQLESLKLRRNALRVLTDGTFFGLDRLLHLQLDYNNLTEVTVSWLYGLGSLQELHLTHNHIRHLEPDGWQHCSAIEQLNLSNNQLPALTSEMFSHLTRLKTLHLDYNSISSIAPDSFTGLEHLMSLKLNHNLISWAEDEIAGAFSPLISLTRLEIAHNSIHSLPANTFLGLQRLKHLLLNNNPISTIQEGVFDTLTSLTEIHLNSSSLLCDCHASWLTRWLDNSVLGTNPDHTIVLTCAHPIQLQGQAVASVQQSDFTCEDFPKPVIIIHPKSTIALLRNNMSLYCTAASSSSSQMSVEWRKNKQILTSDISTLLIPPPTDDSPISELASTLELVNVSRADEGQYECIVSNDLGATYSNAADIQVHELPTFTKVPQDITVRAGKMARLPCGAIGLPAPQVSWQKDGGDDFPAARERRMHVLPQDDVFFITNVKQEDAGVYSCTAKNPAGTRTANATLSVLETPAFVSPMQNEVTHEGQTAVLECMSAGSPEPSITWERESGVELIDTPRHFYAANGQLLVIVETHVDDAGLYTCIMTNTLGAERGTASLTVIPKGGAGIGFIGENRSHSTSTTTTTGIVVIAVVCCVVGTSLVWVVIIYQTRNKRQGPGTSPGSTPPPNMGSDQGTSPRGLDINSSFTKYAGVDLTGNEYLITPAKGRYNVMSQIPISTDPNMDENDLRMLHYQYQQQRPPLPPRRSSGSDSAHSTHSTESTPDNSTLLQTFHPHGTTPRTTQPPTHTHSHEVLSLNRRSFPADAVYAVPKEATIKRAHSTRVPTGGAAMAASMPNIPPTFRQNSRNHDPSNSTEPQHTHAHIHPAPTSTHPGTHPGTHSGTHPGTHHEAAIPEAQSDMETHPDSNTDCWPPGRPPSSLYGRHSPTYPASDDSSCFQGDTDADTSCVSCSCHDTTLDSCHCGSSPHGHCDAHNMLHGHNRHQSPTEYRHQNGRVAPGTRGEGDVDLSHVALLDRDIVPGQTILPEECTPLNQKSCAV